MREIVLNISAEGRFQFIYSDDLKPLLDEGRAGIFRASSVEPDSRGQWTADMSPIFGPMAGPFATRDEVSLAGKPHSMRMASCGW